MMSCLTVEAGSLRSAILCGRCIASISVVLVWRSNELLIYRHSKVLCPTSVSTRVNVASRAYRSQRGDLCCFVNPLILGFHFRQCLNYSHPFLRQCILALYSSYTSCWLWVRGCVDPACKTSQRSLIQMKQHSHYILSESSTSNTEPKLLLFACGRTHKYVILLLSYVF